MSLKSQFNNFGKLCTILIITKYDKISFNMTLNKENKNRNIQPRQNITQKTTTMNPKKKWIYKICLKMTHPLFDYDNVSRLTPVC